MGLPGPGNSSPILAKPLSEQPLFSVMAASMRTDFMGDSQGNEEGGVHSQLWTRSRPTAATRHEHSRKQETRVVSRQQSAVLLISGPTSVEIPRIALPDFSTHHYGARPRVTTLSMLTSASSSLHVSNISCMSFKPCTFNRGRSSRESGEPRGPLMDSHSLGFS